MSDLNDLVYRCRQGELAAFTELFRSQQSYVYHLALTILRDTQDAQDAVQDTFMRVFKRIGDYRGDSSFRTWLTAIAVNICRDRLRRSKVRKLVSFDWLHGRAATLDVSELIDERERKHTLWTFVDHLDQDLRLTVILYYREQLSAEEVAYVLGLSRKTIYSRLYTARLQLRAMLTDAQTHEIDQGLCGTSFIQNES